MSAPAKRLRRPLAKARTLAPAEFRFEPEAIRIVDRGPDYFGAGRRARADRLTVPGRPTDLFGDVLVRVARVRAMAEGEA